MRENFETHENAQWLRSPRNRLHADYLSNASRGILEYDLTLAARELQFARKTLWQHRKFGPASFIAMDSERVDYCAARLHSIRHEIQKRDQDAKLVAHSRLCREFDDRYTLVQTDYELADIIDYAGSPDAYRADITGAMVKVGDGDYSEIWFTESSRYYDLNAEYLPVSFWTES